MKISSKVLIGIGAGFAAGAVLGILFAPDKGSETRKKIVDQKNKFAESIKNEFTECNEKISELKNDAVNTVKEKIKDFV